MAMANEVADGKCCDNIQKTAMRPVWSEPPLFDDWYSPSSCLTFKNSKAYEEDQVVNSEEGAPGGSHYHLYRGGDGRRPGLCVLK